jgi:IS30 family transposase
VNRALVQTVAHKLRVLWSPQQIAGWLKQTYPRDEGHHVSHETIYRSLFIQARGVLKKELSEHLRRTFRRAVTRQGMRAGQVAATSGVWERCANMAQMSLREASNP